MTDYLKFQSWKNSHFLQMEEIEFSKPSDIFLFVRFTNNTPFLIQSQKILYAESLQECVGYIRHIFLYDIINDITDDLKTDFKKNFDISQTDAISIMNKWYKLGKISQKIDFLKLKKFCRDFNLEFSTRRNTEYEIQVFNGANELKRFVKKRFQKHENFDEQKLSDICSNHLFVPTILKEFLGLLLES